MIKVLLILILILILIKILMIKSSNEELISYWVNNSFNINKMFNVSKEEKKTLLFVKKLGILFFILFFILFLVFASSTLKG